MMLARIIKMDRVTPMLGFTMAYGITSVISSYIITTPDGLRTKEKKDYLGQHLSIMHASLAIFFSTVVYMYENGIDYNAITNFWHILVIGNSLGYFIYDTIYAEFYKLHDNAMRFHHFFALVGLITMYLSSIGGSASVCIIYLVGIWLTEISNPCILKRHILRAEGKEEYLSYSFYENSFAALFISSRVGLGTWYLLKVWDSEINWVYTFVASAIYAVSWFWVFVILSKALKKLNGTNQPLMRLVISVVKYLRARKGLLLVIILLISFALPAGLTKILHVKLLSFEINGFMIL